VYNVLSTAVDVDNLMGLLASVPGDVVSEALYEGTSSIGLMMKAKMALKALGHFGTVRTFYRTKQRADELLEHYERYPSSPGEFGRWQTQRDEIMDRVYETTGADPKY